VARKYKAIKIAKDGFLTGEKDDPIICPVRNANCNINCAWFSAEGGVLRCQNAVIGAVGGKPVRSFHLHTGPLVYDLDGSLLDYDSENSSDDGNGQ
jgi:hypothetical protein